VRACVCVCVRVSLIACDLEIPIMRRPRPAFACLATEKEKNHPINKITNYLTNPIQHNSISGTIVPQLVKQFRE
jgi:hypothetical protein